MNYILILGNNYRDCKEIFQKIKKQKNTKYSYVTKVKHIKGIPFSDYIKTNGFNNNPYKDNILSAIMEENNEKQKLKKDKQQLEFNFNTSIESKPTNKKEEIDLSKENINNLNKLIDELKEDESFESNDYGMDTQIDESELTEETLETINEYNKEENNNNNNIKPVGNPPRGWHARKEYIDEDGNVFNKGDYNGNVKDDN